MFAQPSAIVYSVFERAAVQLELWPSQRTSFFNSVSPH